MAKIGELLRYAKYIIENNKDVNITLEGKLITTFVKGEKLYIPIPNKNTYLVIDFPKRGFFTANQKMKITAKTKPNQELINNLVDEFKKYFFVYESVLANAGFALYGTPSDHKEGLA